MYTVYQCWNLSTVTTESFADTVPTNVDTNNSIDTLAQVAKALQAGGLTVPGAINVQGVQSLANNVWHTSLDGKNRMHYGANDKTFFGSQNGYSWRNKNDIDIMSISDTANFAVTSHGDQQLSTVAINSDGAGYTFYVSPSKYTNGGGLTANHLQLFSYGAGSTINQIMDMWPGAVSIPGRLYAGGRDILAELDTLKTTLDTTNKTLETTIKTGENIHIKTRSGVYNDNDPNQGIYGGTPDKYLGTCGGQGNCGETITTGNSGDRDYRRGNFVIEKG